MGTPEPGIVGWFHRVYELGTNKIPIYLFGTNVGIRDPVTRKKLALIGLPSP